MEVGLKKYQLPPSMARIRYDEGVSQGISLLIVDMEPGAALAAARLLATLDISASFAINPVEAVSNPRIWTQIMLEGHRLESSVLLDATPDWTTETATMEAKEAVMMHAEIFPSEPPSYIVMDIGRFDREVGREVMVELVKNGLDGLLRCGESMLLWDKNKASARIAGFWPDAQVRFEEWLESILSEEEGGVIPIRYQAWVSLSGADDV